jgi:acyl-CoA synthetase (AMP-forming)/AMP-acid ligase II
VIYTSGSTGRPKGAMNTHGGIVNRLLWMQEAFGLTAADRVLQKTPVSFDVSVWELFWPLLTGARVVMARPGGHQDPGYLAAAIAAEEITTVHFVPSMLAAFLETMEAPDLHLPGLRRLCRIIASGEALPEDLRRRCAERLAAPLFNLYGPTEAAVDVTWWPCVDGERTVPIGRPIANVRIHVVDDLFQAVPPGVYGELCIAGVQVARGYLGRPELTAERFVPDPFASVPGERMYRSGDVARWRRDGLLEVLGRRDAQVKIRGFRIEPGEVEAALTALPRVVEAAVVAVDGELVAYVSVSDAAPLGPHPPDPPLPSPPLPPGEGGMEHRSVPQETGGGAPLPAEGGAMGEGSGVRSLRHALATRLPAPMIPSRITVLDELPRTPNGKIDRRALASRRPETLEGGEGGAPRTPTEELLAGVWSDLLGVEHVGREDDFFALGGHSLLAARVMARVEAALGAELSVRTVFEAPTLAALAQRVDAAARSGRGIGGMRAPILRRFARSGEPLPLSFAQEWMWLIDQLDPTASAFSVTFPIRLGGRLDAGALGRALTGVARRHEILRTTFPVVDGRPLQRIAPEPTLDLAVVDLSALSVPSADPDNSEDIERFAATAVESTLDLQRGPLIAAVLLRRAADDHTLLLTLHHILFDGWSAGILLREVAAFYQGSPLPELPIQYGDFAVWQREWLQGAAEEPLLAWWREKLTPPPPRLDLPGAKREPVTTLRSARLPWSAGPETTAALHALARREGATLFMVLLARSGRRCSTAPRGRPTSRSARRSPAAPGARWKT